MQSEQIDENETKPMQSQENADAAGVEAKTQEEIDDENYLKPNWNNEVSRFDDMGLKDDLLRGIYSYGFKTPSPI